MRSRRLSSFLGGYESRSSMIFGCFDNRFGHGRYVTFPTSQHDASRTVLSSMNRRHRPFTNRMRENIRRSMRGLEPLSSESETESETEEKLSEATTTSTTQEEKDLQADAPPLKLEDVIPPPPTQASSSRNKKRRNKKLVSKTTPPPN